MPPQVLAACKAYRGLGRWQDAILLVASSLSESREGNQGNPSSVVKERGEPKTVVVESSAAASAQLAQLAQPAQRGKGRGRAMGRLEGAIVEAVLACMEAGEFFSAER